MSVNREEVYKAIDGEREYQDLRWGNPEHDQSETVGNFLIYIERFLSQAKDTFIDNGAAPQALEHVRKIAALAVACMEQHGAPQRPEGILELMRRQADERRASNS